MNIIKMGWDSFCFNRVWVRNGEPFIPELWSSWGVGPQDGVRWVCSTQKVLSSAAMNVAAEGEGQIYLEPPNHQPGSL